MIASSSGSGPVKAGISASPTSPDSTFSTSKMDPSHPISADAHPVLGSMGPQKQRKKRVRNWTAEDRAVHREFEKSRREAFSERLMELAGLLPMLNADHRPSKHVIVDASVSYHRTQQVRNHKATSALQELMAERDDLLRELNTLRTLCEPAAVPRQARPIDPAVLEMLTETNGLDGTGWSPSRCASSPKNPEDSDPGPPRGLAMPQVTASVPAQIQMPHPEPLYSNVHHPVLAHNTGFWDLQDQNQSTKPSTLPAHLQATTLSWDQSPSPSTTAPPKDMDLGYSATSLHLVDDATSFWTQHPILPTNTPPRDPNLHFDPNTSHLPGDVPLHWSPDIGIDTFITSRNFDQIANHQPFQAANSFVPNPENLSI